MIMERLGCSTQDLISDPRIKVQMRKHWLLSTNQLLIRCKNNYGLSVLHDLAYPDLFEAGLVRFSGPEWDDRKLILVEDDVFRCVTKEQVFSLIEQVEQMTDGCFGNKKRLKIAKPFSFIGSQEKIAHTPQ
jgi:hypothetical protein